MADRTDRSQAGEPFAGLLRAQLGAALALNVAVGLGAAACSTPEPGPAPVRPGGGQANTIRDANIAVQEELQLARKAGTVAAYDLFIARHPDHALTDVARRERLRLLTPSQNSG